MIWQDAKGRGKNREFRSGLNFCGAKNKGPAREILCKPLIFLGCLPGRAPGEGRIASVTFRMTLLLGIQQRWASLQRAPVAGIPYLLALSKSSLSGVLGG